MHVGEFERTQVKEGLPGVPPASAAPALVVALVVVLAVVVAVVVVAVK